MSDTHMEGSEGEDQDLKHSQRVRDVAASYRGYANTTSEEAAEEIKQAALKVIEELEAERAERHFGPEGRERAMGIERAVNYEPDEEALEGVWDQMLQTLTDLDERMGSFNERLSARLAETERLFED